MSITDELRKWAKGPTLSSWMAEHLTTIADRIDAEHERVRAESSITIIDMTDESMGEHGWIRLPKDADGEYIHVGDEVKDVDYDGHASVFDMHIATDGWWVCAGGVCRRPDSYRHYHTSTVEDILREFTDTILEWSKKSGTIAEVGTWSDIAAEYITKLQLKED